MRPLTNSEANYVDSHSKPLDQLPVFKTEAGIRQISRETESWLLLLPNEMKLILIQLIDKTKARVRDAHGISSRLSRELADSQNLFFNQKRTVYVQDIGDYDQMQNYLSAGYTITGDPTENFIPDEAKPLMTLLRMPIGATSSDSNQYEYETRLNDYICKLKDTAGFVEEDTKYLQNWREVLAEYTEGVDQIQQPSANTSITSDLSTAVPVNTTGGIAWGQKFPKPAEWPQFKEKLMQVCAKLGIQPDWLMAVMMAESNLRADIVNTISKATGLIQFMPKSAKALGTTVDDLKKMTATQQLDYVYLYFKPYANKMKSVSDVYAIVFMPVALGKESSYVMGKKGDSGQLVPGLSKNAVYTQNAGLDLNKDSVITAAELTARATNYLAKGAQFKA